MGLHPNQIGEFLTHYSVTGDTIVLDTHVLEEAQVIGHGEIYFPNRVLEFTVFVVTDPHITETISMTQVDDFGGFEIVIHHRHLFPMPDVNLYQKVVQIACIRQLTRFAIEEMPVEYKDPSHSTLGLGSHYKAFPVLLDYKPEVQAFFTNQCIESENASTRHAFHNSIVVALLHGGVIIREYELDLEMLRFFTSEDLTFFHWLTVRDRHNPVIQKEMRNRTKRLTNQLWNGDVYHPEFELQLEIY